MPLVPVNPASLSPDEQKELAAAESAQPATGALTPVNPLRDLSAQELSELQAKSPDTFDITAEFQKQKDLWGDQAIVQKAADAYNLVKQRGFQISDLPGPKKILGTAFDVAKGFGKQAWNYLQAGGAAVAGAIAGGKTEDEMLQEAQQRVAENIAGTESAGFGLAQMAKRGVEKFAQEKGIFPKPEELTPEERVKDLFDAVGSAETNKEIEKGHGGFLQPVGGHVISELEQAGKPVRPEEVQQLAAGDPVSWYLFGKTLQGAAGVAPGALPAAREFVGQAIGKAGQAVEAAGKGIEKVGEAAPNIAPTAGALLGATKAGPAGVFPGIAGGRVAGKTVQKTLGGAGELTGEAGKSLQDLGSQIATAKIQGSIPQLVRDIGASVPKVAAEAGKGAALDIGLAAATSETPQETGSVGLGASLGLLHGLGKAGKHVISGQIVAPREFGSSVETPSSGNFPSLDAMHQAAMNTVEPGVKLRMNAIRQFVSGAAPGTDVYLAPDVPTLARELTQLGMSQSQANKFAGNLGFFTAELPDASGTPRRVIIARDPGAVPHESFHAIQDVIGEEGNRQLDQIVRKEYANQWDYEGRRYASRAHVDLSQKTWEEGVLDETGWGLDAAKEKLIDRLGEQKAAEVLPQLVADAKARNPNATAQQVWRDVLSPEEAKTEADRYLARELAAENFDAVFKAGLSDKGKLRTFALAAAGLLRGLGIEPLSTRRTETGKVEPRFRVTEAVRGAAAAGPEQAPAGGEPPILPTAPPPNKPTITPVSTTEAEEARRLANEAPAVSAKGTRSPQELLGTIAEAIASRGGVRINYLSAPDEPAAATTSNRDVRREIIEAYRTMPPESRALWEKTFFPERVLKTKTGYQVQGWAPEVFAANAHKMAFFLSEVDPSLSPFEIDPKTRTFTPDGWKKLYEATQLFVQNQTGGKTGAGRPLVTPEFIRERGYYAPESKGLGVVIPQNQADFINLLFNFKLPETPRMVKGKLPLNVAGQEVSAATEPGRVEIPVRPRGEYTGTEAEIMGIGGRRIMEVNPLRNDIEAAAQKAGKAMPSLIEAVQKLNLENIKEVEATPEQPQFRGNTLTLSAGFQPRARSFFDETTDEERQARPNLSSEPDAIKIAAVRAPSGRVYEADNFGYPTHGGALAKAREAGESVVARRGSPGFIEGFVTNAGEFLNRKEAFKRAKEFGQITGEEFMPRPGELESISFERSAHGQFQPSVESMIAARDRELRKTEERNTLFAEVDREIQDALKKNPAFFEEALTALVNPEDRKNNIGTSSLDVARKVRQAVMDPSNNWDMDVDEYVKNNLPDLHKRINDVNEESPLGGGAQISGAFQPRQWKVEGTRNGTRDEMTVEAETEAEARTKAANSGLRPTKASPVEGYGAAAMFQPANPEAIEKMTPEEFTNWTKNLPNRGFTQVAYETGKQAAEAGPEAVAKLRDAYDRMRKQTNQLMREDIQAAMTTSFKGQFFREAWEAATGLGSGGEMLRKLKGGQFQPAAAAAELPAEQPEERKAEVRVLPKFQKEPEPPKERGPLIPPPPVPRRRDEEQPGAQFQPKGNEDVQKVAEGYAKSAGINYAPSRRFDQVPEELARRVADHYEAAKSNPKDAEVKKSYSALAEETVQQFHAIEDAGYTMEPWTGKGEPYKSSADMTQDVRENKHLWYLPTSEAGALGKENPMMADSGIEINGDPVPVNDVFRAVHDFFGHAKEGYQFGPRGEFNAWRTHSEMYSPEAQGALAAETLAQNFWVNYGKHLRDAKGKIPAKGEPGYVPAPERPFAEQKNIVIPEEFLKEARVQLQPTAEEYEQEKRDKLTGRNRLTWGDFARLLDPQALLAPVDKENLQEGSLTGEDLQKYGYKSIDYRDNNSLHDPQTYPVLSKLNGRFPATDEGLKAAYKAARDFEIKAFEFSRRSPGQFQPEEKYDDIFVMPKGAAPGGFKKAWITPEGNPVQLGGMWHAQWLDANRDELAKKYGITDLPKFEGTDTDVARQKALQAGFARINYNVKNGQLTVEARMDDWRKLREPVRQFAESNIGDIDSMTVHLLDAASQNVVERQHKQLFQYNTDAEKMANLPLPEVGGQQSKERGPAEPEAGVLRPDRSYNPSENYFKGQAQPEEDLFGELARATEKKKSLTNAEVAKMSQKELKNYYPEAIVPRDREEKLQSNITESPLYKKAKTEDKAVQAFADKLVKFAKDNQDDPAFKAGARWYSEFVPKLKAAFGKDARTFAELLAATSPQTNVTQNFKYAVDALESYKAGRFDKIIVKFEEGLAMLKHDTWRNWYDAEKAAGRVVKPPAKPTPEAFMAHWIAMNDLKPKQSNGNLYGTHSTRVLQVFARVWLEKTKGPKTRNFVENLLGEGHEATIDLWADRTMRRMGYEGYQDRWRILPLNQAPVKDADFYFSQKAFRAAAERLGMQPDALQGALWFAEKKHWAKNGWGKLDLGDFQTEMKKLPKLREQFKKNVENSAERATVEQRKLQL